jgi:hypothetical protein
VKKLSPTLYVDGESVGRILDSSFSSSVAGFVLFGRVDVAFVDFIDGELNLA